jgi:hypothetical protein
VLHRSGVLRESHSGAPNCAAQALCFERIHMFLEGVFVEITLGILGTLLGRLWKVFWEAFDLKGAQMEPRVPLRASKGTQVGLQGC